MLAVRSSSSLGPKPHPALITPHPRHRSWFLRGRPVRVTHSSGEALEEPYPNNGVLSCWWRS